MNTIPPFRPTTAQHRAAAAEFFAQALTSECLHHQSYLMREVMRRLRYARTPLQTFLQSHFLGQHKHKATPTLIESDGGVVHRCPICDEVQKSKYALNGHMKRHRNAAHH